LKEDYMKKRLLGILLSFAMMLTMVVGLMPGMSLTALAWEGDPYASLVNTAVKFDGKDWYLIEDNSTAINAGTVTLLSKECVGASQYDSNNSSTYSGSTVETFVNTWYTENISADAKTAVSDNKMFLLKTDQANATTEYVRKCSKADGAKENEWWLCSPGYYDEFECDAACVDGGSGVVNESGESVTYTLGVRPALKLDLSKVAFDSESKTFSIPTLYPLWVGGTQVTSANAANIDGNNKASYDAETKTLTLNNYSYSGEGYRSDISATAGIYSEGIDLNIELIGTNTITTNGSAQAQSGIDIVNGNLTITARDNGSLTATGGNSNGEGSISNGICVRRTSDDSARDSKLTIADGATVSAAVNTTIGFASGTGVYADDGIDVSGTLTADGGNGGTSIGVFTGENLDVRGTLTATAGSGASESYGISGSYGIRALKNVTVYEGGVVNASAIGNASADMNKGAGIYTWGWYDRSKESFINGNVIIRGGVVNATSANGKGIECRGDVIIKDGEVTATGQECGIQCGEKNWETGKLETGIVSFEGGTITATGKGSEIEAGSVSTASSGVAGIAAPTIEIKSGINSLTATGKEKAIAGTVKNEIAGTGWTNTEGTVGKAKINISSSGQELPDYKRVQFPEKVDPKPEPPKPTPAPVVNNVPVVNTTAKTSARSMTVKWTWNNVPGAKSYKVSYHKVGSKKWTTKTTKKTKYVVKGHKMKGLYEYKVAAVTASGDVWSNTSCRYFKGVKTKAKAGKAAGTVRASWKKDKGATGYQVKLATNKKLNGAQVVNVSANQKSYTFSGLKSGKKYYVSVRPLKDHNGVTYQGIRCKALKVKTK
jgi:hypothetical protein